MAKSALGKRLREARDRTGLTQTQLSRVLDVDSMQVSRWERGVVEPRPVHLVSLAQALGVSAEWLVTGEQHGRSADQQLPDVNGGAR